VWSWPDTYLWWLDTNIRIVAYGEDLHEDCGFDLWEQLPDAEMTWKEQPLEYSAKCAGA